MGYGSQLVVELSACMILQAVVNANSQSNGNSQISTASEIHERILKKHGLYSYVMGLITHENLFDAATMYVACVNM